MPYQKPTHGAYNTWIDRKMADRVDNRLAGGNGNPKNARAARRAMRCGYGAEKPLRSRRRRAR